MDRPIVKSSSSGRRWGSCTSLDYQEIEIPFGAKDSELKGWEYTIPDGFEAEIKDGKVVVREKESEDERIRKFIKEELEFSLAELDPMIIPEKGKEREKQ